MRIIRYVREYYHKLMEIPDSAKKIARGVALGTALDFLPIPFISILVAYILARIIGSNSGAAVLAAVFFKWAVPFFYALNYMMGSLIYGALLGGTIEHNAVVPAVNAVTPELSLHFWSKLKEIGYPFLVGSFINSLLAGSLIYFLFKRVLEKHQKRRLKKEQSKV